MKKTITGAAFIIAPLVAGAIGSYFTFSAIPEWYDFLVKPFLNPPSWVFGPVWTILYLLMGVSGYLVWRKGNRKERGVFLTWFVVQLLLNAAWSIIFFGARNPEAAFMDLILLWLAIGMNIFLAKKVSLAPVWLLIPYLLWVTFAGYLNLSIALLN